MSFLEGLFVFVVRLKKGWIERFRYKKLVGEKMEMIYS